MQILARFILLFAHAALLMVWVDWTGEVISQDINIFIVFGYMLTYVLGGVSFMLHGIRLMKFITNKNK